MFVNTPLAWLATRGSPWPVARRSHQQDTCGGRWLRLAGPARAPNGRSARQPACTRSIDPTLGRDQCCWLTEAMMLTGSAYLSASMVPGRISLHGAIGRGARAQLQPVSVGSSRSGRWAILEEARCGLEQRTPPLGRARAASAGPSPVQNGGSSWTPGFYTRTIIRLKGTGGT